MKTILVLEDEPCVMAVLKNVLSRQYTVLESTTTSEAFQQFLKHGGKIDLLIADAILPVSSGIQAALALRLRLPNLRIMFISGYPESMWPDRELAQLDELPSDEIAILQKPFFPAILLKTVGLLIGAPAKLTRASCSTPGAA
jgi:two-component system, cell cycle sensor histidine kinase and response regulator CckA